MKSDAAVHMKIWSLVDVGLLLYNVGRVVSGPASCILRLALAMIVGWRCLGWISGMTVPAGSGVGIRIPLCVWRIMRRTICVPCISTIYASVRIQGCSVMRIARARAP